MKVYTRKIIPIDKSIDEKLQLMLTDEYKETCEESSFLYLTLDLPPQPLFKDELHENIIPQVPLYTILSKFNGINEKEYKTYKVCSKVQTPYNFYIFIFSFYLLGFYDETI